MCVCVGVLGGVGCLKGVDWCGWVVSRAAWGRDWVEGVGGGEGWGGVRVCVCVGGGAQ